MQFIDVVIRQAHPGPDAGPYRHFTEKMRDARRFQEEERIPWPVLVDDLRGTVHQVYGGLADPTYLIDADGKVAFYDMWTYAPRLHEAITELDARGGRGVVKEGLARMPHLGPSMTDGWRGLRRGLPQSVTDLMLSAPGSAAMIWAGYQMRPLLAPLTLRARPLPTVAKVGLLVGAGLALGLAARWATSHRNSFERKVMV